MNTYNQETKQEKLDRIIKVKIIPFLTRVIACVPNGLADMLSASIKIINSINEQYIEEAGPSDDGHLLFLESGIAQNFYYDPLREKQITNHISKKHEVIMDVNSFVNRTERTGNIQMLEAGTVVSISYSRLRELLVHFPQLQVVQWQLQAEREKQYIYYQHLLKLTLDERVKIYLDDNPGIATRINNDYIASYLGTGRARFSTAYAKYRNATTKIL